jgi:N-acetylmuramic acid 6-phosphate etherase
MDDLAPTEAANPSTADIDMLDTRSLVARINAEDRVAASAVERALDAIATAVDEIAQRLRRGGRLHYFGAGTSGRLGVLDAAEIPPTFSVDPRIVVGHIAGGAAALSRAVEEAEDDASAGADEAANAGIGPEDAVVGLSASGSAAYVVGAVEAARRAGALTVAITNAPGSALAKSASIAIVLETGAEAIAGSTRMKAASAQRMTLTALSTAVMVRLGKVHGNLMVDLTATNKKLRARALRLTQLLTGRDQDDALRALRDSGYRVKVAAVMLARDCGADDARAALDARDGSLREALADKNTGSAR